MTDMAGMDAAAEAATAAVAEMAAIAGTMTAAVAEISAAAGMAVMAEGMTAAAMVTDLLHGTPTAGAMARDFWGLTAAIPSAAKAESSLQRALSRIGRGILRCETHQTKRHPPACGDASVCTLLFDFELYCIGCAAATPTWPLSTYRCTARPPPRPDSRRSPGSDTWTDPGKQWESCGFLRPQSNLSPPCWGWSR